MAVLLEGYFTSLYKNQFTEDFQKLLATQQIPFKPKSINNKMIVVADGDIASNDFDANNVPLALGYDKYSRQVFANKDFLLNCVEYLVDDNNLIEARNREVKMRLLDKAKVLEQKGKWQLITFVVPLLFTLIFGLIYQFQRKKKKSSQAIRFYSQFTFKPCFLLTKIIYLIFQQLVQRILICKMKEETIF